MMRNGATATSGLSKAAMLLVSLGPEVASDVLRHLDETEVRQLSQALARVSAVPSEALQEVTTELRSLLQEGSGIAVDGREFARTVVQRALADPKSAAASRKDEILAEIEHLADGDPAALTRALQGVPADGLALLLQGEHPQIAALILAHVSAGQAGAVLAHLPEELQGDVIERLAKLEAVPPALVAEVGAIVREQVKGLLRAPGSALGGPKAVADLMNHADKTLEARIFEEIEKRDPELVTTIRNLMFTFEDCLRLDNRSMQTLLKEVTREDLLLALKTASPTLTDKVFANVSSRAAEILKEDMASSGPVRLRDVEAAQGRVIAMLRELESEGKLVVAGSGKDDVLV
jgi:flagellar motor switch protein FliG